MAETVEKRIVHRLRTATETASLVGQRITPVVLPDTVVPAITYRRLSGVREASLGSSNVFATFLIELSAWGSTYEMARNLADATRQALDGWSDEANGVEIGFVNDGPDLYEVEAPVGCNYRCLLELQVMFKES